MSGHSTSQFLDVIIIEIERDGVKIRFILDVIVEMKANWLDVRQREVMTLLLIQKLSGCRG